MLPEIKKRMNAIPRQRSPPAPVAAAKTSATGEVNHLLTPFSSIFPAISLSPYFTDEKIEGLRVLNRDWLKAHPPSGETTQKNPM